MACLAQEGVKPIAVVEVCLSNSSPSTTFSHIAFFVVLFDRLLLNSRMLCNHKQVHDADDLDSASLDAALRGDDAAAAASAALAAAEEKKFAKPSRPGGGGRRLMK